MFEMFDQFLYIAILMFGAYVTLYIKNRGYSGILLIVCSILSNILLFSVVLDPFIFITLPITAALLLNDFAGDYRSGIVSRKHKLGALIAGVIIVYDIIFIMQVANLNLVKSYNLFTIGSIIGTFTGFYLVIYPLKELKQERDENLQAIYKQENLEIEKKQDKIVDKTSLSDEELSTTTANHKNITHDKEKAPNSKNNKIFGIDILYFRVGGIVLLMLLGSIIYNFATRTVLDMQDYIFVTVEPDALVDAKVGYYASFEHFDKNNFYNELIDEGKAYGLSEEEITKYTPVYTSDIAKMFKKLNIKVAQDKETVNNGDVVTTNITYDENYARKNNIVLKNTNFKTEINQLPVLLTSIDQAPSDDLKKFSRTRVEASDKAKGYNLDVEPTYAYITEDGYISIVVTYSGDLKEGLLSPGDETVSFKITPYLSDKQLMFEEQIERVNLEKLEATEF